MIGCLVLGHAISALCADCVGGFCPGVAEPPSAALTDKPRYELTVTSGSRASIPGDGLGAQLTSVEDNRCAVEVKCVWAGYAVVRFRVGKGDDAPADLAVGDVRSGNAGAAYGPYRFELLGLEPLNSMAKPPPLPSYRARLQVTKAAG